MSSKIASWESQGNKHIDIEGLQIPLPYHEMVSDLAIKHSQDNDKILDIGCGIGQMCHEIKRKGLRDVHAADAYQVCLDRTQVLAGVETTYLIEEDNFNIQDSIDEQFSIVIMSHVLEHMLNPVQAVKDALSLVEKNGHLILAVPNPARPSVLVTNMVKKHYVNRGHVVAWDMSHWMNFLENIMNLTVVGYYHDYIQLPGERRFPKIRSVGKAFGKVLPWWCFSNIAVIKNV